MMRFKALLMVIGFLWPTVVLCQKKAYKQGLAFEERGELTLAMERYKAALYKNMYFSKAKIALKNCAEQRVEHLLSDYFVAREKREWEEAKQISQVVTHLREEMNYFSIDIELPAYQEDRFLDDDNKLLEEKYQKAQQEYQQKHYQKARDRLEAILEMYPAHDASSQLLASIDQLETEEKAVSAFKAGNYFLAYDLYSELLKSDPEHKDYIEHLNRSKVNGSMSVAIVDLTEAKNSQSKALKTAVLSEMTGWSHPLLAMIEREDLDLLVQEQKQAFTGLFDENTVAAPGLLKGVQQLLMIRLEDIQYNKLPSQTRQLTAYEMVESKVFDGDGNWRVKTEFLPRQYTENLEQVSVTASLHFKLLEVQTGNILMAKKVAASIADEIVSANYTGNPSSLLPTRNDQIVQSGPYLENFRATFHQSKPLKTESQLYMELEAKLAADVAAGIKKSLSGGKR
ncbi:hypothetical protein QQ020_15290 [Fulvivirgaceae bacterium BMA12]|uniref:SbsC C-terminal domain-containing protein n=1 Tax=Agaribacillus aureus TaxID=3051825 RepID=A0ABT8L6Q5_9BACT|nr:hypothetical protein [Fulvivirgaceae bacterium BMA12]